VRVVEVFRTRIVEYVLRYGVIIWRFEGSNRIVSPASCKGVAMNHPRDLHEPRVGHDPVKGRYELHVRSIGKLQSVSRVKTCCSEDPTVVLSHYRCLAMRNAQGNTSGELRMN
jgi:hypothetical protein